MEDIHNDKFSRSERAAWRTIEGKTIIIDATNRRALALNETASAIWEALDGDSSLKELVIKHIVESYEVKPETAIQEISELIAQLYDKGLVTKC